MVGCTKRVKDLFGLGKGELPEADGREETDNLRRRRGVVGITVKKTPRKGLDG